MARPSKLKSRGKRGRNALKKLRVTGTAGLESEQLENHIKEHCGDIIVAMELCPKMMFLTILASDLNQALKLDSSTFQSRLLRAQLAEDKHQPTGISPNHQERVTALLESRSSTTQGPRSPIPSAQPGPRWSTNKLELIEQLRANGHAIIHEKGDGSCLFNGSARQVSMITGREVTPLQLRQEACDFMQANPVYFESFVTCRDGEFPEQALARNIEAMRRPGNYGDQLEILAIAAVHNVVVRIFSIENGSLSWRDFAPEAYVTHPIGMIQLAHSDPSSHWNCHFDTVIASNDIQEPLKSQESNEPLDNYKPKADAPTSKKQSSVKDEKWKTRKNLVGEAPVNWWKKGKKAVAEAKEIVQDPSLDFVLDACLASGGGVEVIKAVAHMAKSESNTPVEQGARDIIKDIVETGLRFETSGDVNSPIVLPDDPIAKADALLQREKTTRTKTGEAIERIPGYEHRAHFGSHHTSDTTHTLVQRYPTTNHQDQGGFNHIDYKNDPGCNIAAMVTTPNWLNNDNNAQTGSSNVVPTNLKDVIHMADQNIITLDNPLWDPDAPKVDEQREAFAKAAKSSVVNTAALALLHQIVGYCNSLLRGTKHTVLISSAEVYEESYDCVPPNSNSLVNILGSLCHMQNLTQATRNLATRADGELELYTKRLANFFRHPLGLADDFQSDYLMKRSGRFKLTDEQKRWIDEEAFKARSKGGSTCLDEKKGIFDPRKLPDGYDNWGEVARDEEKGIFGLSDKEAFKARSKGGSTCLDEKKGIFDPRKLPDGYDNWGEVARDVEKGIFGLSDEEAFKACSKGGSTCLDEKKGIFDPRKLPDGYDNWNDVQRDNKTGIHAEGTRRKANVECIRKRMIKRSGEGKGVFVLQCTYRPSTKKTKADWSGGCGEETWTVGVKSGETFQCNCKKCATSPHKKWAKRSESLNLKQINIACDSLLANESLQDVLAKLEVLLKPKSGKKRSRSVASASLKSSADVESEIKPKSGKKRSHSAASASLKSSADVESEIKPKSGKKRSRSVASASLKSSADVESEIKPKSGKKRSRSAPIIQSCACEGGCKDNNCPCRRIHGKPCGEHCSCKGCENCPRKSGTITGYFQSKSK